MQNGFLQCLFTDFNFAVNFINQLEKYAELFLTEFKNFLRVYSNSV